MIPPPLDNAETTAAAAAAAAAAVAAAAAAASAASFPSPSLSSCSSMTMFSSLVVGEGGLSNWSAEEVFITVQLLAFIIYACLSGNEKI